MSLKVLVVDDSSTMLRIITNVLNQLNINDVLTAKDGKEAWDLFQKHVFDIILTDWNMPNMNGLDLVKHIRNIDKEIPIIMITTEGGKTEVITALKAGVNNYIIKPFNAETLKEKLEKFIS